MNKQFLLLLLLFLPAGNIIYGQVLKQLPLSVKRANLPDNQLHLKASKGEEVFHLFENDIPEMKDFFIEFDVCPRNSESKFGIIARYNNEQDWTYVGCDLTSDILCYSHWFVSTPQHKQQIAKDIAKFYKNYRRHIRIECFDKSVSVYVDGEKVTHYATSLLGDKAGYVGFRAHDGAEVEISNIRYASLHPAKEYKVKPSNLVLSSEQLEVNFCKDFPVVVNYRFKTCNEIIQGARTTTRAFVINGQLYPAKTSSAKRENKIVYQSTLPDIDVSITTECTVEENRLNMQITGIEERGVFRVKTLGFFNHDLIIIDADEKNAMLSWSENVSKDYFYPLSGKSMDTVAVCASIAILNTDKYAVTIDNNSAYNAKQICFRTVNADTKNSYTSLFSNEWIYRGFTGETLPLPQQKVIFAADENKDGVINWQDGAVALAKEYPEPYGADKSRNSYASIAMNFASCGQYPFLRILDNVKKFYLATDGFGQMIELKGYQSEGHDSGHPDYAGNYNRRAGGLRDLQFLTEQAARYNAQIGIHINHSESYPEAKAFDKDIITDIPGWAWLDQAWLINKEQDVKQGTFEQRLSKLKEELPYLSFIYLDTYREHRYLSYKTARLFNDFNWSIWTEDSDIFFREGIWVHHPGGEAKSLISRFVHHQFRDGYTAHPLLLGGYSRSAEIGFMGWQKGRDFTGVIRRFFTEQLPYRFLMKQSLLQIDEKEARFSDEVVSYLQDNENYISVYGNDVKRGKTVFIPWQSGKTEKIYHYNPDGGVTSWILPPAWQNLKTVKLYLLNEYGRHFLQDLPVTNMRQVSVNALPDQGYVLYQAEAPVEVAMKWGEGGLIVNPGFDGELTGWEVRNGEPVVEKTGYGQSLLRIAGEGSVKQSIKLSPGEYTVSVWFNIIGQGDVKLIFNNEVYSVNESSVKNYTDNSDRYNTYFQRIKLPVTHSVEAGNLELSFSAHNDTSYVYFDDVRIVVQKKRTVTGNCYFEDFEDVDEGWGPFVAAKPSAYTTHLSELHEGFTDDTLEGRYSLKTWREGNGEVYRTVPSIIRFKPEKEYQMQFLYKVTNDDVYRVVVQSKKDDCEVLNEMLNDEGIFRGKFVTGLASDYYVVITKEGNGTLIIDDFKIEGELGRF